MRNREVRFGYAKHLEKGQKLGAFYKVHDIHFLDFLIKVHKLEKENNYNVFTSLAEYNKGIPDHICGEGKKLGSWRTDHWKHMASYYFFLDIDADDFNEVAIALFSTRELLKLFDDDNIPYYVRFSGKGFHILIPEYAFGTHSRNPKDKYNIYNLYQKIADGLRDDVSIMIDKRNKFDSFRKIKCPYTLSNYKDQQYLCMPLEKGHLRNFELGFMKPRYWLEQTKLNQEVVYNTGNAFKLIKRYAKEWLPS